MFEDLKECAINYFSKKVVFNPQLKEIKLPYIIESIYNEISDKEKIKLLQFIGKYNYLEIANYFLMKLRTKLNHFGRILKLHFYLMIGLLKLNFKLK